MIVFINRDVLLDGLIILRPYQNRLYLVYFDVGKDISCNTYLLGEISERSIEKSQK